MGAFRRVIGRRHDLVYDGCSRLWESDILKPDVGDTVNMDAAMEGDSTLSQRWDVVDESWNRGEVHG